MGLMVWGLGFRAYGLGLRESLGFRGLGFSGILADVCFCF